MRGLVSSDGGLTFQEQAQERTEEGGGAGIAVIRGWIVLPLSCSSTVSLRLRSAQMLKGQVVEYTGCFALAESVNMVLDVHRKHKAY